MTAKHLKKSKKLEAIKALRKIGPQLQIGRAAAALKLARDISS
jgi:hypothetical protein